MPDKTPEAARVSALADVRVPKGASRVNGGSVKRLLNKTLK